MANAIQEQTSSSVVKADGLSFNVEHDAIMSALTTCAKVAPKSSAIPIMKCIKFDLNGDTLFVTATDTTQSVLLQLKVENTGNQNGSYLFPSREGIELVKRLPSGTLSFSVKEASVHISYGKGSASLRVLDPDEFPQLPALQGAKFLHIPIDALRKGAAAQRFASTDENTPILCGVKIYEAEGKLGFVATNRHRIYRYISDVTIPDPANFRGGAIDAIHFKSIVDSFKDADRIAMALSDAWLILRDRNIVYFGRLLEGNYPNVTDVMKLPQQPIVAKIPRGPLDETLNRMLSLESENHRVFFLRSDDGELVVKSESQTGEIVETIEGSVVDDGLTMVKFNGRYLRDALAVGDRDVKDVVLHMTGPSSPAYMLYDGDPSKTNVVLPVR